MGSELASGSRLLTIGYQGRTLNELLRRLRAHDVRLLIDVRRNARSRRPQFNGSSLATALASAGIGYLHMPALGSPIGIRQALHEHGDFERFAGLFLAYVRRWRLDDLHALVRAASRERTACILCYESDQEVCHRSIVAREAERITNRLTIRHL